MILGSVHTNFYRDSIALMRISSQLREMPGVSQAEVLAATPANIESLREIGLLPDEVANAQSGDVIVVVDAQTLEAADEGIKLASDLLTQSRKTAGTRGTRIFSLETATGAIRNANLALISIPGPYVRREAIRAMESGLNLMIFSDNVPLSDEIEIKRKAAERDLWVMGPDCGTAIIGGLGLGFANSVRQGSIGIVAASGTGLQEVSCLIERAGIGVSHAIGTGSNDVTEPVGGSTLLRGLMHLDADRQTEAIVVLTKPPAASVIDRLKDAIVTLRKPATLAILGADLASLESSRVHISSTLEDAALSAVHSAGGSLEITDPGPARIESERRGLAASQRFVRGVYSGGTFATEATIILKSKLKEISTNTGLLGARMMKDPRVSEGHVCVDVGADEFTRGRPHPMLSPSLRRDRILQEAADPSTAVLLLDVVLGYGVHPDPAGELLRILREARATAGVAGRNLPIVASVCGTEGDPQVRSRQVQKLEDAGVLVCGSNASAARTAASLANDNEAAL